MTTPNIYATMQQQLRDAGHTYDKPYVVQRHIDTLEARGLLDAPGINRIEVIERYVEAYARYRAAKVAESEARLMAVSDGWRVAYHELYKVTHND